LGFVKKKYTLFKTKTKVTLKVHIQDIFY